MTAPTPETGSFCWNELATRDAAATRTFYERLFGWECEQARGAGEVGGEYTRFRVGGTPVGGMYAMQGPHFEGVPPHWAVYVSTDDVEATVQLALDAGGKVAWGPFAVPEVGTMAGIADPTGAVIALLEAKGVPHRPDMGSTAGSFCWAELHTNDPEAAGAFYARVFGWDVKSDGGDPTPYYEWNRGGTSIGGMMKIDPHWGDVPPNWVSYVAVDDCDATTAQATELGAEVLVPPMTIPGVGRFSMFKDPGGAALAVIWLDPAHLA